MSTTPGSFHADALPGASWVLQYVRGAVREQANRAPHTLTERNLMWLPDKEVLELRDAGHLVHLGMGLPSPETTAPQSAAAPPEASPVTDAELERMSLEQINQAIAAGRFPGVGPRRTGRRH